MIKNLDYQSEFVRTHLYTKAFLDGYVEGLREGLRSAIIRIALARFTTVTADDEALVSTVMDTVELRLLVVAVATAESYATFHELLASRTKS